MVLDVAILSLAVITNLVLVFLVYVRNPKSATHRLFAALSISLSVWSVINYLSFQVETNPAATWLVRGVMFMSVPIGVFFLLLVHTFPRPELAMSERRFWGVMSLMVVTMGVALSPLLFPTVTPVPNEPPQTTPGIGMVLYVPVVIFGIIYGMYLLVRKYLRSEGVQRVQLGYFVVGVVTMFTLIISLNFVVVNLFKITTLIPFGPLFTLPFTILAAYTMLRHRLLDIRAAILRSLSLSFLLGAFVILYGIVLAFAVPFAVKNFGVGTAIASAVGALAAIPVARGVQRLLTRLTDRFLFQDKVDYRKALVELSRDLSGTIDINEVNATVLHAMSEIVRSKKTIILLRDSTGKEFAPSAQERAKGFQVTLRRDHALITHLEHTATPLLKDDVDVLIEHERSSSHRGELEKVKESFQWLDVFVALPLIVNKEFTGVILLGEKLSGEPYLQDDVEFLATFAPQAATALENARLYKESLEFGEKLEIEVKRATKELAEANEQLKDLDKAKSEFLSIASHQLYTPLTALRGYVSMMLEGDFGRLTGDQKHVVHILDKSAKRLINLIKNLLDVSRIESGKFELNLESADLATTAKELVNDLMPNAVEKNLILQFHEPVEEVPHVVVDQERIRQVMLNVIDNAIKYTDKGHIDVRVGREGDELVFSVSDTGKGISQVDLARLFTKFTRVGDASRYHTEGTGLGLYVARQIVKEHRGDVEVESKGEGKGSTFSMRLPLEGTQRSLKVGERAEVTIRAAEVRG